MFKKLFFISCAVLVLAGLPPYILSGTNDLQATGAPKEETAGIVSVVRPQSADQQVAHYASGVRKVNLQMDNSGHFTGNFRINGRSVDGLIDTGATYIALNTTTAKSLGIRLAPSDFTYGVRTANGTTKAAKVNLERVEIGVIAINNVEAFVLSDDALSATLVGMSFMSKLTSYKVKGRTLEMIN